MADQSVSPEEAKVAKEKLKTIPPDPPQQSIMMVLNIIGADGRVTRITFGGD